MKTILEVNPHLEREWNYTKNQELGLEIDKVSYGSGLKAWWICEVCSHSWISTINNRNHGNGCPYCSNKKSLSGYNDLTTTHPEIAKLLIDQDLAKNVLAGSSQKVDWKCPDCDSVNSHILNELCRRNSCRFCSDKMSTGERLVYALLELANVDFRYDCTTKWSEKRKYDFFILDMSTIIETHGIQHYEKIRRKSKRTLQEEQENDIYKESIAKQNGVDNYIVIDCSKEDIGIMKKEIANSKLLDILNLHEDALDNLIHKENFLTMRIWEYYNNGYRVMQISDELKISKNLVRRKLKIGYSLGKCDYESKNRYERVKKPILKINLKGHILERFESLISATESTGKGRLPVTTYPFDIVRVQEESFVWIYEHEREKFNDILIQALNGFELDSYVCQIDKQNNLIDMFKSTVEASEKTGYNYFNISSVLRKRSKTYKGYGWIFRREYEKELK